MSAFQAPDLSRGSAPLLTTCMDKIDLLQIPNDARHYIANALTDLETRLETVDTDTPKRKPKRYTAHCPPPRPKPRPKPTQAPEQPTPIAPSPPPEQPAPKPKRPRRRSLTVNLTDTPGEISPALTDNGADLPLILYVRDIARILGRTEKAVRAAVKRKQLPPFRKIAGRACWVRADLAKVQAETRGERDETTMKISARPAPHNPARMLVTFTIAAHGTQPRLRTNRVAPAGLDHDGAIAWGQRIASEVWRDLMGADKEDSRTKAPLASLAFVAATVTQTPAKPARKLPTLAEYWTRFEAEYLATCKPATRKGYLSAWTNYIRPALGALPIDTIDRSAVSLLREMLGRLQPASRNQVLAKLRTALEVAAGWDLIVDAPEIKREKQGREAEPTAYTDDQAAALVNAAQGEGRDALAMVLLMLHGGLRVSEVCALRWSDVDLEAARMTIAHNYSAGHESTPKGGRAAAVGLSPDLAAALAALPRRGDHVLVRTYKGEQCPHTPHSITHRLHALQLAAGLEPSGPHTLRHTCITIMARGGFPSAMLQKHARHARLSTTERYVHLVADEVSAEATAFWAMRAQTRATAPAGRVAQPRHKRHKTPEIGAIALN